MITSFLHRYYSRMQIRYPDVLWRGDVSGREIALTFDDGPHPKDTPQVLEKLAKHDIRATFFLIGEHVEQYPSLAKQIHKNGHQLGIHCYRHRPFFLENPEALCLQLKHTRDVISIACGIPPETIRDLRPPYGAFTPKILSLLTEWQYRLVMWNIIPPHWVQPLGWTINQMLEQAAPGSVIVLHDGKGHGSKVARIVDIVIPKLKALGFDFVTIEQMYNSIKGKRS